MAATCLAIQSRAVNTRLPLATLLEEQWPWCRDHAAELQRLFAAYGKAKLQQQSLDFDDLLLAWWHLMQVPEMAAHIGGRFDHVLVDELQDVNRLQADITQALKPRGRGLTAVGDDAQSIYAFRGADVRHILDWPQRFTPPARVLTLERNYRSSPAILEASNAVIAAAPERFAKRLWTDRPPATRPRLVTVADEAAQARGVADAVLAQREAGLKLKRQAVLFRTATHSAALELELVRRGIPFVKYGGLRFLEAAHVKDVLAVLRWADNPASQLAALRTVRLVPGMGPASVRRLPGPCGSAQAFKPPPAAAAALAGAGGADGPSAQRCGALARRPGARAGLVPAAPGAAVRRRPRARRRPGTAGAHRCWSARPPALRDRTHARPARGQQQRSRPAAARRGLSDPVHHPQRQGPGVECRACAERGRRLPAGRHVHRPQRRDRGGTTAALRGHDACP
ncbi:MAG: ATP-dependent helicase [Betaproteobacteria bacterium]|nr:ATP-dependent helicase [Betaproteobacteria bacterium]